MKPRYILPRIPAVLLISGTVVLLNGDFTVSWDDGFESFTDFSGTDLTSGGAGNQNGDLVELGYFTEADNSNLFRGNWIPLTTGTRIGDTSDGTDAGDGAFTFSTKFDSTDGSATTFYSSALKSITVGSGGSGYTSAPTVIITRGTGDSSGSGAFATATIGGGAVTGVTITNGGSSYSVDPTITFDGGGGSSASATSDRYDYTDANTGLRSVEVTNGGSGYTENFAVTFSGGGGSGATGEAIVSGGTISKILIRDTGTGYTSLPTVDLSAGSGSSGTATASFLPQSGQLLAIRFYDGTTNAAGTLFNTVAAPSTTPGWNAWPTSDTDPNTPNLSADNTLTGLLFQTDAHSISKDLITAATDIGTGLSVSSLGGSVYTTGNTAGGTLTANLSSNETFSGILSNGFFEDSDDGKLALTKTGTGTLTLNGAANTFSGDTTISGGTLTLTGSATIDNTENIYLSTGTTLNVSGLSSTFTLDDGQSLVGTGSVTGDITFASTNSTGANFQDGSKIKPGDTATNYGIGKIEVTGAGTWNAGTTYQWEINDLTGDAGDANGDGKGWDYLTFSGALTIAGDTNNKILLDIAALDGYNSPYNLLGESGVGNTQRPAINRTLKPGYEFEIVHAEGGITGFNADHFEIEYTHFYQQWDDPFHNWNLTLGNSNKTLYLTYSAVPEPSTYVMVSGLLVLPAITLYRRWKKKKAKATEEVEDSLEKA